MKFATPKKFSWKTACAAGAIFFVLFAALTYWSDRDAASSLRRALIATVFYIPFYYFFMKLAIARMSQTHEK
ncbi:hypothetical protein BG910_01435 [Neisseria chenwenguii]|uniref:Uncharacterized protein n=2 Tax=Neisseria chenwenguii TaxID=1853278 RepID=A0A220RZF6_9NEIS|nr:hypothetical protein BG910_01435 [Neisseria chenwenguii]ROV55403.1 hypothetical protein EGS38_10190 [Neisseria chenwenguii]